MQTALSRLVTDPDSFRQGWPEVPTVYQRDVDDLRQLGTREDAREILTDPDLRPGAFGMVRNGKLTATKACADHPSETLVLNTLHATWPPLITFCKALGIQLGHPVTGNLYLTPAGNEQGFAWHWDCHHVFIAQTEGAKRWKLYKPTFENPLEHHQWSKIGFTEEDQQRFANTDPDFEFLLEAGQVLFIPRGWVHAGQTEDRHSLHITLGVQLLTVHWALKKLVDQAEDSPELRAALPPDLGGVDFMALTDDIRTQFARWVAQHPTEAQAVKLRSGQRLSVLSQERK